MKPKSLTRLIKNMFARLRLLSLLLLASLLLSGCVQYDVGVKFNNPNRGEIVQQIKLGEQLMSFSSESVEEWLNSIESRTRELQGKVRRISDKELIVKIPFNNGAELEEKFNQFFNPAGNKNSRPTSKASEIPAIGSQMSLKQNNLLLLIRNRLSYDLDLRSLSLIATNGNIQLSPGSLLELKFSLNTPWGARSIETAQNAIHPASNQKGRTLVWTFQPGQLNHVEAVFWLPSPIGIGTVLIILFITAGIYLRYNFMPDPRVQFSQPAVREG